MPVLFSKAFKISQTRLNKVGVFNSFLDEDSYFFINFKRLKQTQVPEFKNAYDLVNQYFSGIGKLLYHSQAVGDKLYRTALKNFNFREVNGINLGFSKGVHGAGFGKQLRDVIINDAFQIIKSGTQDPEIFHLCSLFAEKVGPDRLSDMLAGLLYDNIRGYTIRALSELGITPKSYPRHNFDIYGIPENPYKPDTPVLLLPKDILHELPIAKDWFDIDRVCRENEAIKAEINVLIGSEWSKLSAAEKKKKLFNDLFLQPKKMQAVLKTYREIYQPECNFNDNLDYFVQLVLDQINTEVFIAEQQGNSLDVSMLILENYKEWVELHRGWDILKDVSSSKAETSVQTTIHAVAQMYCKFNNWDISPEVDSGRGPADFKISRGQDKTVIEVKLTSNNQCVHGLEIQIEEYAKAEKTDNKIFVLVNNGVNPERVQHVCNKHVEMQRSGKNPARLLIIDATVKKSASKA